MTAIDGSPSAPVIARVRDLRVHFDSKAGRVHAIDGVSFDIRDGEMLGLVGETGCGKSLTGRAFLGLLPQPPAILAGGSVFYSPAGGPPCPECAGEGCDMCIGTGRSTVDLLRVPERTMRGLRGRKIAMIFQDPGKALNPTMTIGAQLAEVFLQHRSEELLREARVDPGERGWQAAALRRLASERERWTDRWLARVPPLRVRANRLHAALEDRVAAALAETRIPMPRRIMRSYPHELSGGMRQRVMIAQALSCDPDLIIADEPTTALDVTIQARILDLIKSLQSRRGTSVLYISHDLSLVRRVCDRVAVMYAGRISESGSVEQVFADPRHPYTLGLLGAVPQSGVRRGRLAAIPGTVPELVEPAPSCRFADRCPRAIAQCRTAEPELRPVRPGHAVACFRAHPESGTESRMEASAP